MAKVRTSPVKPSDQRPAWDTLKPMPQSLISSGRPLIIGHRGAKGLAPENTLAAFQAAVDLRIDGIEFDIQRTRDGHLIVFHDENTIRVTGHDGLVEELTLETIKTLDAGNLFNSAFQGERIPTLHEAFSFLQSTDLLLFIELKEPWRYPGIVAEIATMIRAFDLVERVQVRSFYHDALHELYHIDPEIALSSLWLDRLPADDEVTFKTINALYTLYAPGDIARLQARGQQATAWVVNDQQAAQELIDAGIDGLTSDYPNRLLGLFTRSLPENDQ